MTERVCDCGHGATSHELLDHDERGGAEWRREMKLARWHLICTADVHPGGMDESPWDHVCGCVTNVWEQEPGDPSVDPDTPFVRVEMLRDALREAT